MFKKINGKRGAIRDHKFNESRKLTEISRKDPQKIETEVSKKINIEDDVNEKIEEKKIEENKIRKHDMMKKNERKLIEENTKKLLVKKPTEENYFEENE